MDMKSDMKTPKLCRSYEDLITDICTEFVKQQREILNKSYWEEKTDTWKTPYLKMSYQKRRKISEKIAKALRE